jgi:hypothetical protein
MGHGHKAAAAHWRCLSFQKKEQWQCGQPAACRGEGSVVGPLLAARALPLRCCAASAMLTICTGYA